MRASCGVVFFTTACVLWCCDACSPCAACVWSVCGVADGLPGYAPICAQTETLEAGDTCVQTCIACVWQGVVHVAASWCVPGLCWCLAVRPAACRLCRSGWSACVLQSVWSTQACACVQWGAFLCVAAVLACLCGLCAALLMALQETHLYVLNPGSWMLEAWCRRCALRVGGSGVVQVWCLAVTVPLPCVFPLSVFLPPAGAGAGRAVAGLSARSVAFLTSGALAL